MTNTATLNSSNRNANNCGKLKYILRRKINYYCLKLRNIQTQQSKTYINLNFQERERQTDRDRQRQRHTHRHRERERERQRQWQRKRDITF